jgi:transposase
MEKREALSERVGGREVHKKRGVACRRRFTSSGRVEKDVATFGTTTAQVLALWAWVREGAVTPVAMESTGVYWQPIWHRLDGHVELLWVKARHLKPVPGRKTDVKDAAWSAPLLQGGWRRGSLVPRERGVSGGTERAIARNFRGNARPWSTGDTRCWKTPR